MSNGANSYVTGATITPDNEIELTVQLDDFKPGQTVEISGQATQSCGAIANYYNILQVPDAVAGHQSVSVTAIPLGNFTEDQEIWTFLRVSVVWVTVLGTQPAVQSPTPPAAGVGATWGNVHAATSMDGNKWNPHGG